MAFGCKTIAQRPASIVFKDSEVAFVKANIGKAPLFDQTFKAVKETIDKEIEQGFDVPVPKDMAGGYTHETHRRNYLRMEQASYLFKITEETKYAKFVKEMLLRYTDLYPSLGLHPETRSYSRGKFFWQCLNDANWLVSVSLAYSNISASLTKVERKTIEEGLLKPHALFLSVENPQFFNRIHNHSTWACAAVGMVGLAIGDEKLVDYALYGLPNDNIASDAYDNDGALIKSESMGFLAQIDGLFSPDGIYSEGPYYHRYAIYPFMIFALGLENIRPDLAIFKYRDGALLKSINTLLAQSNLRGDFFPINDAQKGMSIYNSSLIAAVDLAYKYGGQNPSLLSVAESQGEVLLDGAGMLVALNIKDKKPLIRKSEVFADGKNGDMGGLGILRNSNAHEVLFKFGSQGMGHGHFDKLSFSFYEDGEEVIQDYGMARFVNIEQKGGGGYLKENTTFAKQTVGHNTLVINETSHSKGNTDEAEKYAPTLVFNDFTQPGIQGISAEDSKSYDGAIMRRNLFLIDSEVLGNTVLVDIFNVKAEEASQFDLPLYYQGQWLESNFKYKTFETLNKVGQHAGYQHLWKEAAAELNDPTSQFSWLSKGKFYTYTAGAEKNDEIIMARVGASDPDFNLRRDPVLLTRRKNLKETTFISVIETHGAYSPIDEKARNPYGLIQSIEKVLDSESYIVVKISTKAGAEALLCVAKKEFQTKHKIQVNDFSVDWEGPFILKQIKK